MTRSQAGQILLQGDNLTLIGRDLDQTFSNFESSQNFNLLDAGALIFAGPFGLAVTKGHGFASISQGSGGSSRIGKLVSAWEIKQGRAQAKDVAMAADQNRVALQGGLDLVTKRFDNLTVALIDARGCAQVQQQINGSLQKPTVEKPSVFKALTGPARTLLKMGKGLLTGGGCDVFYAGSVGPP